MNSDVSNRSNKVMTTEQFTQVVEAILEGKYSWACLLILRFAGYNPLHYIPYRTYNRLMKDHGRNSRKQSAHPTADSDSSPPNYSRYAAQINDLAYLETLSEKPPHLHGGNAAKNYNILPASINLRHFLHSFEIARPF